jgi:carboxylate-amine ligase
MMASTALDVRDHHFGSSRPYTIGVEEEYMLLDPVTLDLVPRVEQILQAVRGTEFAELVSAELFESLVEFHTPVCATAAELAGALRRLRAHALEVARREELLLASAGTHPFSRFEAQSVTARDRYRALIDVLQYPARRELIFGLHVHVGVPDPDAAIRVMNALRPHLCELVALSANSPLWRGEATGLAACRPGIFAGFPRSGHPPVFRDYAEYADVVDALVAAGCLEDYTRIWWDVRPHPRFGTVEVRVMDAVTRVEDAIGLAAYVQALVHRLATAAPGDLASPHPVLTNENTWRTARYGLEATVADPVDGRAIGVRALVARTLQAIAPDARALGCERELDGVRRILRDGNGASEQLAAFAAGDPAEVVRAVVAGTRGQSAVPSAPSPS